MGLFDAGAFEQPGMGWLSALLSNPDLLNPGGVPKSKGFDGLSNGIFGGPGLPQSAMGGGYGGGVFPSQPEPPAMQAMAQAPQQQPPATPARLPFDPPADPSIGDRLQAGFGGLANSSSLPTALFNFIGGLASGGRQDSAGKTEAMQRYAFGQDQARQKMTYEALVPKLGPAGAMMVMSDPKVREEYAKREFAPYTAHNVGDVAGSFDPKTGTYNPQFQSPKYEKVGAGEKLFQVGGGAPGGAGPREVASGGLEKPPAGYEWRDQANQSAGLKPIAGGPEAKIPANEAGYLAMMNASKEGLAAARKFFLDPSFKSGAMSTAGSAIGQALNAGDIGRAQRDIKMATETALRIMTGAAAPETEVQRYSDMFTPSVYDSHATRVQKLGNLENFLRQAETNMRAGRDAPPDATGWVGLGNGIRIRERK